MSTSVENPTRHSSNGSAESYALPTVAERLGGLLWTLRRRWWILLLLPLLAGGAAWYVAAGDQKQYSATAKVLLSDESEYDALIPHGETSLSGRARITVGDALR